MKPFSEDPRGEVIQAPPRLQAPPRMIEGRDEIAQLLREAGPQFERALPAAPVTARPRWALLVPLGAAAALAVGVVVTRPAPAPRVAVHAAARGPEVAPIAAEPRPADEKVAPPEAAAPPAAPGRLPAGREVALADGSRVRLDEAGAAVLRAPTPALTEVRLQRGGVHLEVTKRAPGEHLEVVAGGYVFRVVGTKFDVRLNGGVARLDVTEGAVAVLAGSRHVRRVLAGESWSGSVETAHDEPGEAAAGEAAPGEAAPREAAPREAAPREAAPREAAPGEAAPREAKRNFEAPREVAIEPPPASAPPAPPAFVPPAAPAPRASTCLEEARRAGQAASPRRTLACLQEVAHTAGLDAEIALFEIARLRRDVLHDLPGALAALREHERRFPGGGLRDEVLTVGADLRARTGDADGALATSALLLVTALAPDQRAELHMLRGNVYNQQKHDCASAAREYAEAARGPGAALADEAKVRRAQCLEQLKREAETTP
jgi:hypothetical protein